MKTYKILKSGTVVIATVASLISSALVYGNNADQLIGKDLKQNRELVETIMRGRNYSLELDLQGKIKQVIDAGENGSGVDAKQPLPITVASTGFIAEESSASEVELPQNFQGQDAINYLGEDLPSVAAYYGLTKDKLIDMLLVDDTVRFDSNKRMLYVDNSADQDLARLEVKSVALSPFATGKPSSLSASALANTFAMHSKPGASKTIYLDFDGHIASNTVWSKTTINAPAFDLTGNPAVFDDKERSNIISIWNRVAEDYIPFDVDVTTAAPAPDAITKDSEDDINYGIRVVITKTGTVRCSCGGVAYVGIVDKINNASYQPAWIFQQSLANNEKYIAEAISHEAGHNLGLIHDGQKKQKSVSPYYYGHGASTTGWAPIMGAGYYENVTQWDNGTFPGANNQQDDFAVFASYGILPRMDDVGNSIITASSLVNLSNLTTANIQTLGVIETSSDVDMYRFNTVGGPVSLTASPVATGPNLDIKMAVLNSAGKVIASNASKTTLSAAVTINLPAGQYFLMVSGSDRAQVNAADYGYSNYGSVGQYQITGSFQTNGMAVPPSAVINASTLKGPAPLAINFSANQSIANGSIVGYLWSFGDGTTATTANPVHSFSSVGTYTVSLTVINQYFLTSTTSVQISVIAPPAPQDFTLVAKAGITLEKSTKTAAKVLIKVVNRYKQPVPNATVTGAWSGVFNGLVTAKTDASGSVVLRSNGVNRNKNASGTFTIKISVA